MSLTPFSPAAATQAMLTEKTIPALNEIQYQEWTEYLFSASFSVRIAAAETVFRHNRQHPYAQDLFLACAWPLANTIVQAVVRSMDPPPSDLTYELLFDGAVNAAIEMFEDQLPEQINFRRAICWRMKSRALKNFFGRFENTRIRYMGSREPRSQETTFERQVEAKEILEQIDALEPEPHIACVYRFVRCILEIGPHDALKVFRYSAGLQIDLEPVMQKLQIGPEAARHHLCQARKLLRQTFNPDGTLFIRNRPSKKR